jgi:hypothetical protein
MGVAVESPGVDVEEEHEEGEIEGEELGVDPPPRVTREGVVWLEALPPVTKLEGGVGAKGVAVKMVEWVAPPKPPPEV